MCRQCTITSNRHRPYWWWAPEIMLICSMVAGLIVGCSVVSLNQAIHAPPAYMVMDSDHE